MHCLLSLLLCSLLCGCNARVPEPITYPYSQQQKMQASHHWQVLSHDLANRINNELVLSDHMASIIYVKETCGDESRPCDATETSSFNEAFRDLLITSLYDYGIPIASRPDPDVIKVYYKVQIVRHNSNRPRTLQPGIFTTLSTAIIVLRNATSDASLFAAGLAADIANMNMATHGHYEVIITTSIIDKGKYLFRSSDLYYINDKDFFHYLDQKAGPGIITLKQKESVKPKKVKETAFPSAPLPAEPQPDPSQQTGTGI